MYRRDSDCLFDTVVKASASRAEDPGFDSSFPPEDFSGSSHTHDLKTDTPVATLPSCLELMSQRWEWLAQCQYTVIGCNRKFDAQLLSQCGSMYNGLSRSVP